MTTWEDRAFQIVADDAVRTARIYQAIQYLSAEIANEVLATGQKENE